MSKRDWDGSFSESKYVETGNMVNDVIENDGRILHEATPDGYTHEMVDRGTYISDDYYFPRRIPGKKPYIHYEIRSSGDILIDGKKIATGGKNAMKRIRMRNISTIEGTQLNNGASENIKRGEQLDKLGRDYLGDKAKLEQQYEAIVNDPTLDRSHKLLQLRELKEAVIKLQEDYEKEVTAKQQEVQENLKVINEKLKTAENALEEQVDSLRGVRMDVAKADTSAAAEAAEIEKQKFREWHAKNVEALNLRLEQQQQQRRDILRDNLKGR